MYQKLSKLSKVEVYASEVGKSGLLWQQGPSLPVPVIERYKILAFFMNMTFYFEFERDLS